MKESQRSFPSDIDVVSALSAHVLVRPTEVRELALHKNSAQKESFEACRVSAAKEQTACLLWAGADKALQTCIHKANAGSPGFESCQQQILPSFVLGFLPISISNLGS